MAIFQLLLQAIKRDGETGTTDDGRPSGIAFAGAAVVMILCSAVLLGTG